MLVTIKTLQQKQVKIDIEPSNTVEELKAKIKESAECGSPEIERQKLIYSGKILANEQVVETVGIKEGDFIVLMVTSGAPKPKPAPAAAPAKPATSIPLNPDLPNTTANVAGTSGESALVTGAAYEEAVSRITEMGFTRENAVKALRASFNNPDRAVEYLTSGFPLPEIDETEGAGTAPAAGEEYESEEEDGDAEMIAAAQMGEEENPSNALEFLRQDPQFQQLRSVIQQNPQLLGPIIEQLGQSSPELFQLIQQHEDEFIALMNEGPDGEPLLGEEDIAGLGQNTRVIQLTEEENAAVERLQALGFDKARAVEAYFACDKNEELAANFLFESMGDEDF